MSPIQFLAQNDWLMFCGYGWQSFGGSIQLLAKAKEYVMVAAYWYENGDMPKEQKLPKIKFRR